MDIESRKQNTNYIINKLSKISLVLFKDNAGYFILFIHSLCTFIILYNLLFGIINTYYYIYIFVFIVILISHHYFHGCILIKVERKLFKNKKWPGFVYMCVYFFTSLFNISFDYSQTNLNYVTSLFFGMVSFIIIYRLL